MEPRNGVFLQIWGHFLRAKEERRRGARHEEEEEGGGGGGEAGVESGVRKMRESNFLYS